MGGGALRRAYKILALIMGLMALGLAIADFMPWWPAFTHTRWHDVLWIVFGSVALAFSVIGFIRNRERNPS